VIHFYVQFLSVQIPSMLNLTRYKLKLSHGYHIHNCKYVNNISYVLFKHVFDYLRTKCYVRSWNGSLVIALKRKPKFSFCPGTTLLFYIPRKKLP